MTEENDTTSKNTKSDEPRRNRTDVQLVKRTDAVDKLLIHNKQLQKELSEADSEIDDLSNRLEESNIRISKNLFYVGLIFAGYLIYTGNVNLNAVTNRLTEVNVILEEYKAEIEKTKLYNNILEKKLGISVEE